jgi:hypothetical protein
VKGEESLGLDDDLAKGKWDSGENEKKNVHR